jgi:cyclopropane-fatty-acyl-phospholipid synthase
MNQAKRVILELLEAANIPFNSDQPWSLHVKDERLWQRVMSQKQLGLGESYMDGWWECAAIDEMLTRLLTVDLSNVLKPNLALVLAFLRSSFVNRQRFGQAARNAKFHYNIGNDLYQRMLGKEMVYSCAYWENANSLDEAQANKLDLICKKLKLEPEMTVLDIGSGWGGFLRHAVRNYGVHGVGISPADQQNLLARELSAGLDIDFQQKDYREMTGTFDRVVSVGMMEHVGPKNLKAFFKKCSELLTPNGVMFHHTIGATFSKNVTDPFFDKYIFPGGVLPSLGQISRAVENELIIEDVHNIGPHYDPTLMAWKRNISTRWDEIPHYDQRFRRMWEYYLLASAAGFRSRRLQLFQVVLRKEGHLSEYRSVRW